MKHLCPIMSRNVTRPGPDNLDGEETNDDYLIEQECAGDDCMFWVDLEDMCALKVLALQLIRVRDADGDR